MATSRHIQLHGEDITLTVTTCGHSLGCGCSGISDCCCKCPLDYCRYEVVGGLRAVLNMTRNKKIIALSQQGQSVKSIVNEFNLSRRTVQKVIKQNNNV